jgi:hypothetical protein
MLNYGQKTQGRVINHNLVRRGFYNLRNPKRKWHNIPSKTTYFSHPTHDHEVLKEYRARINYMQPHGPTIMIN